MEQKNLIIIILGVVIALLCAGIAYMLLTPETEYVSISLAENGTTMEIPDNMAIKSNNNGIQVFESDDAIIVSFNSIGRSADDILTFDNIKNPIFGNANSGEVTIKDPNVAGCSLSGECKGVYKSNNETGDNVIVISKNKDIVSHVINSIKWQAPPSNDDDNAAVSSGPTAYAYKSDGTPMYSQAEVDRYMLNKYGMVDYHVGDNGYIDMDEPGFDDAGHWVGY